MLARLEAAMNSWRLFTFGVAFWNADEHPIFLREADHEPAWYKAVQRVRRVAPLSVALVAGVFFLWFAVILLFENVLFFLLLPRFVLIIATGLALAPIVVDERVKRSWETLLAAPFSAEELLLGKVSGALWWLRHGFIAASALLSIVAIGVGFISLALIPTSLPVLDDLPIYVLCFGVIIFPIIGAIAFVIDRIQQYLLVISAAVAVSTSSSSVRTAFFSAIPAGLMIWLLEVTIAGALLALQSGRTNVIAETNLLSLVTLGPVVNFIMEFELAETVLWTGCTFLGREIAIRALWRWAEYRARTF
jgi:hypothetical protein